MKLTFLWLLFFVNTNSFSITYRNPLCKIYFRLWRSIYGREVPDSDDIEHSLRATVSPRLSTGICQGLASHTQNSRTESYCSYKSSFVVQTWGFVMFLSCIVWDRIYSRNLHGHFDNSFHEFAIFLSDTVKHGQKHWSFNWFCVFIVYNWKWYILGFTIIVFYYSLLL